MFENLGLIALQQTRKTISVKKEVNLAGKQNEFVGQPTNFLPHPIMQLFHSL